MQEVNDPLVATGFALVLNLVVGAQMYVYWGRTAGQEGMAKVHDEMLLSAAKVDGREKVDVILQPQSPLLQQVHECGYDHMRASQQLTMYIE